MTRQDRSSRMGFPTAVVAGALVWLALIVARLAGLATLTLIDVLFLLAPLVVVPLGFRLVHFADGLPSRLMHLALLVQPVGAVLAVVAFLVPKGLIAGALAACWLVVCGIAALAALAELISGRSIDPVRLIPAAAVGLLSFGAAWLVLSRAGIAPLGLDPQIVELTAVHFHFTAFAATLLAALVMIRLRDERGIWSGSGVLFSALLVIGSPILAAGWGTPIHVFQVAGALLIATGVIGSATIMLLRATTLATAGAARLLLRIAALCPLLPMVLAVEYSTGHIFGFRTLDIHTMALIHGDLNALGFVLPGLMAWSLTERAYGRAGTVSRNAGMTSLANSSS